MKTVKRLSLLLLCTVLILSVVLTSSSAFNASEYTATEYGYYDIGGNILEYPITGRFLETFNDVDGWTYFCHWYREWYIWLGCSDEEELLDYMTSVWLQYYYLGDPEKWCEDYLGYIKPFLANARVNEPPYVSQFGTELYNFAVDSYSWDNNTLTVQCSSDYDITYTCTPHGYMADVYVMGYVPVMFYLGFTNKSDGSLVNLAKIDGAWLSGEFRYGSSGYYDINDLEPELKEILDTGEKINYTCSDIETFTVEMPDFYDAEKHDVTLYFVRYIEGYDINPLYGTFYNPTVLTRDDIVEPEPEPEPPVSSETESPEPEPPVSSETEPPEPEPPVSSETEPPEPEAFRGDANNDGVLNLADVTVTLKYLAEWENIVIDEVLADVSGNGKVTLADVSFMLQIIAGWNV